MHDLKKVFDERQIYISLHCFDANDLSIGWLVQYIIDNQDIFSDMCLNYPLCELNNLSDYYLYLLYVKLASLRVILPHLTHDDHKRIVEQLVSSVESELSKIADGQIVKFINCHFRDIFENDSHDHVFHEMQEITAEYVGKYSCGGIDISVLQLLCENNGYLIIDKFELFEKAFEKNALLFEKLFPSGHLSEIDNYRYSETLAIWAYLFNKTKSNLKHLITDRTSVLAEEILSLAENASVDNAVQTEATVNEFIAFLRIIKSPKANGFDSVEKSLHEKVKQAVEKNGQQMSYELPIGEIMEKWKATESWELKLLLLTHDIVTVNNTAVLKSRLSVETGKKHLWDYVNGNRRTDEFFTMSHQNMLDIRKLINAGMIYYLMQDSTLFNDYCGTLASAVAFLEEKLCATGENLQNDIEFLLCMINLLAGNKGVHEKVVQAICYSSSMYICAFIEKLLRTLYRFLTRNDFYVPLEKATLGSLLNPENRYLEKVFGKNHLKNLSYFLIQTGPEKIGENYRNKLAHWSDISSSDMKPLLVDELLWLLTDVVNTMITYFDGDAYLEEGMA